MTLPSGARLDGYRVEEHLADGAEAEVYRGADVVTGEPVVLKVPHDSVLTQPMLGARWRREARLMEKLDHARLQCLVDRGRRHSRPYLALEFVPGGSVRTWMSVHGPVPIDQAVAWGHQLIEALAYIHGLGVVHRDLKPENVLITDDSAVKLGDFGAAARYRTWLPWRPPEPPEGTAGYVSPEVVGGLRGDPRSDVYGWGVLMYELLTGASPFHAEASVDLLKAPLTQHPRRLREVRSDIPPALEAVVLTTMRRNPDHRYRDVQALDADLKRLDELDASTFDLSPEPPHSVSASEFQALVRFAAVLAASFVAVVATLIILTIVL
jgi:serine/threonine protein kinase